MRPTPYGYDGCICYCGWRWCNPFHILIASYAEKEVRTRWSHTSMPSVFSRQSRYDDCAVLLLVPYICCSKQWRPNMYKSKINSYVLYTCSLLHFLHAVSCLEAPTVVILIYFFLKNLWKKHILLQM